MRRAVRVVGEKLPHGWNDLFKQVGLFMLANLVYETARGVADGSHAVAFEHGRQVIDFEASTGTLFEPHLQAMILPYQWLIDFANQIYLNSQFAVFVSFLIWLYLFRNQAFYFVRNMVLAAMTLSAVGYTLYPTAPPRLFPEHGFVDTITDYSGVNHDSGLAKLFINPYAAVPSLHCCFALLIGVTGVRVCRNNFAKAFWAFWPLLVFWVVVVTGNHYWVDAALGALVAAVAALVAVRLARARPEAWAFRNVPREAQA